MKRLNLHPFAFRFRGVRTSRAVLSNFVLPPGTLVFGGSVSTVFLLCWIRLKIAILYSFPCGRTDIEGRQHALTLWEDYTYVYIYPYIYIYVYIFPPLSPEKMSVEKTPKCYNLKQPDKARVPLPALLKQRGHRGARGCCPELPGSAAALASPRRGRAGRGLPSPRPTAGRAAAAAGSHRKGRLRWISPNAG